MEPSSPQTSPTRSSSDEEYLSFSVDMLKKNAAAAGPSNGSPEDQSRSSPESDQGDVFDGPPMSKPMTSSRRSSTNHDRIETNGSTSKATTVERESVPKVFFGSSDQEGSDSSLTPTASTSTSTLREARFASSTSNPDAAGPSSSSAATLSSSTSTLRASRAKPIKSTPLTSNSHPAFPAPHCLASVRSPPKKRTLILAPEETTDITGLTGVHPSSASTSHSSDPSFALSGKNEFRHNDSYDLTLKKNRRPRLFGFTEMVPDSPETSSAGSSRPGSAFSSREPSPTRQGSMEMIPRTRRYTGSLERTISTTPRGRTVALQPEQEVEEQKVHEDTAASLAESTMTNSNDSDVVAKDFASESVAPAAAVPAMNLVRKTSLTRSQSELGLRHLAPVKPIRPGPLGSRTSAQRNESALKLDLNGIRETHDKAPGSAPMSSYNGPYSPATALLRKKSGEVVKPALKAVSSYGDITTLDAPLSSARSAPNTPGAPKYVHFDTQLERVKLFLHDQKPQVVSRNGSPTDCTTSEGEEYPFPYTDEEDNNETTLQIKLPNFPNSQPRDANISLESIFLDDDRKNLKGIIRVKNIAFEKWVAVRFTLDWWQTTNETSATYKDSVQGGAYDRFQFSLKLQDMMSKIEEKNLFICLRYMAGTQEIWDNNSGSNYLVTFAKVITSRASSIVASRPSTSNGVGMIAPGMGRAIGGRTSQWDVAGKRQDRMADLRMHLDRLSQGDDEPKATSDRSARFSNGIRSSPSKSDRLPSPRLRDNGPSSPQPLFSPLAGRYDFGTSLNNARGGKARSPSARFNDLPGSPGGFNFSSTASVGPSMEFYSPQLSSADLPSLNRSEAATPTASERPAAKGSSLYLDTLPPPVLQIQEPSPPMDYFSSAAPAQTTGPTRKTMDQPRTALPRQYSEPPFPVAGLQLYDRAPSSNSNALGLQGDADASPPSISGSLDSSASDSPDSPVEQDLPAQRSSSVDDIANMSYKTILEQ